MNILYPSDKAQTEEINSLTYGQFRQRFPKLEGVKLPRPERLLKDAETNVINIRGKMWYTATG